MPADLSNHEPIYIGHNKESVVVFDKTLSDTIAGDIVATCKSSAYVILTDEVRQKFIFRLCLDFSRS